jgi:RecB family exonuclease
MSDTALQTTAETPPRASAFRFEACDRCPAAHRFGCVLRLPQPVTDQRPRLLGSVAHSLLEEYVQEVLRTGARAPVARVDAIAAELVEHGGVPVTAARNRDATSAATFARDFQQVGVSRSCLPERAPR